MLSFAFLGMFSTVMASDCTFDGFGYYCDLGDICQALSCECDGTMITGGSMCGTTCAWDGSFYTCNDGDYCDGGPCECDGSMINDEDICNGTNPTAPVSCNHAGESFFVGQSVQRFVTGEVDYGNSCIAGVVTCSNVAGSGVLGGDVSYLYTGCIVLPPVVTIMTGDCNLPRGGTIASGDTITAYQASSVACGSTCVSEVRTCNSGFLDGSYTNQSCSTSSCGGGGGGGGGGSSTTICELEDLICVDGIYEEAEGVNCRYGELGDACEMSSTGNDSGVDYNFTRIGDITNSPYSAELNLAYLYAYNMGITDMDNIFDANMEGNLIRSHMAKMLVEWAVNVMGLESNTDVVCDFDDIDGLQGQDLYNFVIDACQMGLMGLDSDGNPADSFNPYDVVTRAQFGTVLSRSIWGDYYNGGVPYYTDHLDVLHTVEIMNNISDPYMFELRGYVMLMLLRANQLLQ